MNHITITMKPASFPAFLPLLQQGFQLPLKTVCGVKAFITSAVCPDPAYIDNRIQTVFLNGKAVDDMETTLIRNGDVLALSAAMPGLVGATFRRGGAYAAFRRNVSVGGGTTPDNRATGAVTVKLFNIIASEVGRKLLQAGVMAELNLVRDALASINDELTVVLDGRETDVDALGGLSEATALVGLKLNLE